MEVSIELKWSDTFPKDLIGNKKITRLKVKSYYLDKPFPSEIGTMSNLEELYLPHSRITAIPKSIAKLKKLKILHLDANELTSLPDEMAQLAKLEELNISGNKVKKFPEFLRHCKQLKKLDYSGNKIGRLPRWIGEMTCLEELKGGDNRSRQLPPTFGRLAALKILNLKRNKISRLDEGFANLKNLQSLNLGGNDLASVPNFIFDFTQLQYLNLGSANIDRFPPEIGNLKQLHTLITSKSIVHFPDEMKQLQALENFTFSVSDSLPKFPEVLAYLPLKKFNDIWGTRNKWGWDYANAYNDSLGKSMNAADIPLETRRHIFHLININAAVINDLKLEDLLYALRVNNQLLTQITQKLLFHRYKEALENKPLSKKSSITVLGTTRFKKTELKERLLELGLGYSSSIKKGTTHVVIGKKIGKFKNFDLPGLVYIDEFELSTFLDKTEDQFLLKESPHNSVNIENISRLLLSKNQENVELGIALAKSGGVPEAIFTDLFLITKNTNFDLKLRKNARALLELKCSSALKEKLKGRKAFLQSFINGDTLTKNLKFYLKAPEFDRKKIYKYVYDFSGNLPSKLVKRFTKEDRDELLHHAFQKGSDQKARLTTELFPIKSPKEFFQFHHAQDVCLMQESLSSLPEEFRPFKDVKKLNLIGNRLRDLPDWFAEFKDLRELLLNNNPFSHVPPVLAELPNLQLISFYLCPVQRKKSKMVLEGFRCDVKAGRFFRL